MNLDPDYKSLLKEGCGWAETLQTQALVNQEALNKGYESEELLEWFERSHKMYRELEKIRDRLVDEDRGKVTVPDLRDQRGTEINKKKLERSGFDEFLPPEDYMEAHTYCRNSGDTEVNLENAYSSIQTAIFDYEKLVDRAIQDYGLEIEPISEIPKKDHDAVIL